MNSSKGRNFPSTGQKDEKFLLFQSFFSQKSSTVTYHSVLTTHLKINCQKALKKTSKSQNNEKNIEFSKKTLVLKTFLWTRILQFWRRRWKNFNKKATSFGTVSKHGKKSFSKSITFSINFPNGQVGADFTAPPKKLQQKIFLKLRKWWKKK